MEILLQLGANQTAFIQFILFVITISFLTVFVFNPYFKAYDKRHALTKGADLVTYETQDEAKKLEQVYQLRAREINDKIKNVFDQAKNEGTSSAGKIIDEAKAETFAETDKAIQQIDSQKKNAEQQLHVISKDISEEIYNKVTGANA